MGAVQRVLWRFLCEERVKLRVQAHAAKKSLSRVDFEMQKVIFGSLSQLSMN
jgi:hypothetical protein